MAGVIVFAVLVAVIFVYPRQWTRGFIVNDEMYFATLARNIAEGRGYVTLAIDPFIADEVEGFPVAELTRPPGFAVFYAAVMKLGPSDLTAGLGLSIFWLAVTMLALFRLSDRIFASTRTSLLICGLYLATSTTLVHATMASPEMQFDALFLLMCWALVSLTPARCLAAGIFLHLCVATKMLGAPYLLLVPGYVLWATGIESQRDRSDAPRRLWSAAWLPAIDVRNAAGHLAPLMLGAVASWLVITNVANVPGAAQAQTTKRYAYNFLMETTDFPTVGAAWAMIEPPTPLSYFSEHPGELVKRTAKLMSRTPTVLNEVGATPFRGSLAALLLVVFALAFTVGWPQPDPDIRRYLWFCAATFVVTLPAVWSYLVRVRYFFQLYPLMLIMIAAQAVRLKESWGGWKPAARRAVLVAALIALIGYPLALTLRQAYRDPYAFVGRGQAVRVLDYEVLGDDVRRHVPAGAVVVTDFAYEIPWLTGNPTIFPAIDDAESRWLIDRFDVQAVALRTYSEPRLESQLADFELRVERPGYRIWVRQRP